MRSGDASLRSRPLPGCFDNRPWGRLFIAEEGAGPWKFEFGTVQGHDWPTAIVWSDGYQWHLTNVARATVLRMIRWVFQLHDPEFHRLVGEVTMSDDDLSVLVEPAPGVIDLKGQVARAG
jgi:hypothetical protein